MQDRGFLVLKSSAGSGKTYTLVRYYLLLALSRPTPSYYTGILAITFTNAAAAEMKERVLQRLQEFSAVPGPDSPSRALFNDLRDAIGITDAELARRSGEVLGHVLHHYGQLGISTIDSFTHRLIRSFARDLHIAPDASIEVNNEDFLERIVDECLALVGQDKELTAYLQAYVRDLVEEEKSWKIRDSLAAFAQVLLKEDARSALDLLREVPLPAFAERRRAIRERMRDLELEVTSIARKCLEAIDAAGLGPADFYQKGRGTYSYFTKIAGGTWEAPGSNAIKCMETSWGGKKAHPSFGTLDPVLNEGVRRIMDWLEGPAHREYTLLGLVVGQVYAIGLLAQMDDIARRLREEQNLLLVSDFQQIVAEVVAQSPAPFIYERVGERYRHILIDEFQDTSALQWFNFLPLIENALASDQLCLVVGDGKQAIYRWRNGQVEQFVQLPALPPGQPAGRQELFRSAWREEHLATNYRSARSIINFNNHLYAETAALLGPLSTVYDQQAQHSHRNREGFVKVSTLVPGTDESPVDAACAQTLAIVRQCLSDGYSPGDIAVLTRKGPKEGGVIATYLKQHGLDVETNDSLSLRSSPSCRLVMCILEWLIDPTDSYIGYGVLRAVSDAFPERWEHNDLVERFSDRNQRPAKIRTAELIAACFPSAQTSEWNAMQLHSLLPEVIRSTGMTTDIFLETLCAHLHHFANQPDHDLETIALWWKERGDRITVKTPPHAGAVKVMTVHKSKGLQFPVVIHPRFAPKGNTSNALWIQPEFASADLPAALVRYSPPKDPSLAPKEFIVEMERERLDQLNILYVATTRPEERLYLLLDTGTNDPLGTHLLTRLSAKGPGPEWTFGTLETAPERKGRAEEAITVAQRIPGGGKPALRFQKREDLAHEAFGRRLFGELLHEAFSLLEGPSELSSAIDRLVLRYPESEAILRGEVWSALSELTSDPSIARWFDPAAEHLREREVVDLQGRVHRPDRVLLYPDRVDILDLKTGIPRPEHREQVLRYTSLLQAALGRPAYGFLLYVQDRKLVAVTPS